MNDLFDDELTAETVRALEFAAERYGDSLRGPHLHELASIVANRVLRHAERSGSIVSMEKHRQKVRSLESAVDINRNNWAAATVRADQQLGDLQQALSSLEDQHLARLIAQQVGVLLLDVAA